MEEVRRARLRDVRVLYSSEKNVKVNQTGIGITAIGFVSNSAVKISQCAVEDEVFALGEPYVQSEVIQDERNRMLPDTLDVIKLRMNRVVHELIPAGSKGILYEARLIAEDSELIFEPLASPQINLKKSAGPATVLLLAIRRGSLDKIRRVLGAKPIQKIGTLRRR